MQKSSLLGAAVGALLFCAFLWSLRQERAALVASLPDARRAHDASPPPAPGAPAARHEEILSRDERLAGVLGKAPLLRGELVASRARAGQRVILLHGAAFNATIWRASGTMQALATAGHSSFALDLPGFAQSQSTGPALEPDAVLAALLDEAQVRAAFLPAWFEPPFVVAIASRGAMYGLPYACKRASALAGLVLVAPIMSFVPGGASASCVRGVPALVMYGSRDPLRQRDAAAMQTWLKHCPVQYTTLEGAGHACYLDDPSGFNDALVGFVNGLAGGA